MNDEEFRAQIRLILGPVGIILVCLPLLFDLVPRNPWYGVRVREAFASDEAWYAVNRLGGAALIGACVVWIAAAIYLPRKYVQPIGVAAVILTLIALTVIKKWTL
jgi:uncharacterized membrane protein